MAVFSVGAGSGMFDAANDDPREPYRKLLEQRYRTAQQAWSIADTNLAENLSGYSHIDNLLGQAFTSDRERIEAARVEWDTVKRLHTLLVADFPQFLLEWEG